MKEFTPTQGRYLSFIAKYTKQRGCPPAESEIAAAMCVSAPSVNQMVRSLERKGLIERRPGEARSIRVLVSNDELADPSGSRAGKPKSSKAVRRKTRQPLSSPLTLYVLQVFLTGGPIGPRFSNKVISRTIEIGGNQTLEQLHNAIFEAYDRHDRHLYEFQFGKRPFDPDGPNYGVSGPGEKGQSRDARKTQLDDLGLKVHRVFGYWFDFGDDWFHQISVERIEQQIPTINYPRVIKRVGKSPPQYA